MIGHAFYRPFSTFLYFCGTLCTLPKWLVRGDIRSEVVRSAWGTLYSKMLVGLKWCRTSRGVALCEVQTWVKDRLQTDAF